MVPTYLLVLLLHKNWLKTNNEMLNKAKGLQFQELVTWTLKIKARR